MEMLYTDAENGEAENNRGGKRRRGREMYLSARSPQLQPKLTEVRGRELETHHPVCSSLQIPYM